jgi:hypothetical protein
MTCRRFLSARGKRQEKNCNAEFGSKWIWVGKESKRYVSATVKGGLTDNLYVDSLHRLTLSNTCSSRSTAPKSRIRLPATTRCCQVMARVIGGVFGGGRAGLHKIRFRGAGEDHACCVSNWRYQAEGKCGMVPHMHELLSGFLRGLILSSSDNASPKG